eukprot:TRINITY_DN8105_c0_g1_i1.p1 TRINITY_DN8105_c0_g1~~TRINITY_DN8105_c0_g1_i1.p1  ORF type:complete len:307 (-),score=31.40 TRINITY_DN8105_c0_g1_i1:81-1001(-)
MDLQTSTKVTTLPLLGSAVILVFIPQACSPSIFTDMQVRLLRMCGGLAILSSSYLLAYPQAEKPTRNVCVQLLLCSHSFANFVLSASNFKPVTWAVVTLASLTLHFLFIRILEERRLGLHLVFMAACLCAGRSCTCFFQGEPRRMTETAPSTSAAEIAVGVSAASNLVCITAGCCTFHGIRNVELFEDIPWLFRAFTRLRDCLTSRTYVSAVQLPPATIGHPGSSILPWEQVIEKLMLRELRNRQLAVLSMKLIQQQQVLLLGELLRMKEARVHEARLRDDALQHDLNEISIGSLSYSSSDATLHS